MTRSLAALGLLGAVACHGVLAQDAGSLAGQAPGPTAPPNPTSGAAPGATPATAPATSAPADGALAPADQATPAAAPAAAPAAQRARRSKGQNATTPPPDPDPGDTDTQDLDRSEVIGVKNDADKRRESTAAKIVVGREEIERFGDSTLDEVLKRLPSVSIVGRARRGGSIVMRGMGHGYTQILINGERVPPGFSIDQLVPDQVERIEIYRAPTAETGARAIAGTINIVLREALRTHINEVRLQLSDEVGRGQSNVSWVRNDVLGDKGTYNVTLSVAQTNFLTQTSTQRLFTDTASGATLLDQKGETNQSDRRDNVHFTSRLQYQLAPGEQFIVQPFFTLSKTLTQIDGQLNQSIGSTPEQYASSLSIGEAQQALGRVQLQWNKQLSQAMKLEVHGSVGGFTSSSAALLNQFNSAGGHVLTQDATTDIHDRSWLLTAKLTDRLESGHVLVGGGEIEDLQRVEAAQTNQNGVPLLAAFGSDVDASVLRTALYLQDDWQPFEHWAADAGIRAEDIRTTSDNMAFSVDNNSEVITPLAHVVWRFDEPSRDQVRLSLTRSYRTPSLNSLIALPSVNTLYPVTEQNVASAADTEGNPNLKPELATGLDIALEHYDFSGGVMSISAFDRSIHDLIRNVITLQSTLYSPVQRYVSQPVNFGNATTQGIEADAKFSLDTLGLGLWPIFLNANMSVFHSHVNGVFGPNNRIDQQPNVIANLGGDYTFKSAPLKIGGNVSWTPPFTIQSTDIQSTSFGLRRQLDLYALWTVDPDTKLRFSLTNALPVNYITGTTTIQGAQTQSVLTNGKTTTLAAIRLELRL
jgi:iron complex outermembrane receptor protein